MIAIGLLFVRMLCDCFKPGQQLQVEMLVLRHQLNVLRQRASRRPHLRWADRALLIWLYRRCPRILSAMTIVRPETVLRWHRMGFVAYWRWKSRSPGGRPRIAKEVRDLIRRMSLRSDGRKPCRSARQRTDGPVRVGATWQPKSGILRGGFCPYVLLAGICLTTTFW
jgi:hypothetical protein